MSAAATTETELIRRSQQGDEQAFGDLVRSYYRLVVSVAYRLCNDPDLAQDVAQETFVKAWRALPRFRPKNEKSTGLRAWLCRIAVNTTVDEMRRQRPVTEVEKIPLAGGVRPADVLDRAEEIAAVRRAVARLPEHSRAALILREYEGLSYQEIAEALNIPIGTVMSRLNYARQRLREELEHYLMASER